MVEDYLLNTPWLPMALWVVLYLGDYYLTLIGARMYKKQPFLKIQGSYELTPRYQKAVDNPRWFSPTMIVPIFVGVLLLFIFGYAPNMPRYLFGFVIGLLLFVETGVYMRHVANIYQFSMLAKPDAGVSGQVTMPRNMVYKNSSFQLMYLGVFTLIAWALTMESSILLGGGIGFMIQAFKHYRLARQKLPEAATETPKADQAR